MKIEKIVIDLGDKKKLELTLDEAKALKLALSDIDKNTQYVPYYPMYPNYPWYYTQSDYTFTTIDSKPNTSGDLYPLFYNNQ